jgi:hypothetical protein
LPAGFEELERAEGVFDGGSGNLAAQTSVGGPGTRQLFGRTPGRIKRRRDVTGLHLGLGLCAGQQEGASEPEQPLVGLRAARAAPATLGGR